MKKITGFFYRLSYKLTHHYLGQISLTNLIWILIVLPPALALLRRVSWWYAVPLSLGSIFLFAGVKMAEKKRYLLFEPAHFPKSGENTKPIVADEQVEGWASGRFAVGGNSRQMLHEKARYSFVSTREHIVMARIEWTRFLWFAKSSRAQVGWWYVFFEPQHVSQVKTGYISDRFKMRPGLALIFYSKDTGQEETIYLTFANTATLWRVVDDMQIDAAAQTFHL